LQRGINYLHVNPTDSFLGPVPWEWFTETVTKTESRYCQVEMKWFQNDQNDGQNSKNQCTVRFSDFVDDLTGTMARVYQDCMGRETLQAHIPKEHPARNRKNCTVNRSMQDLGLDEEALQERSADYTAWISN
jgi:hypothetical protein